MILLSARIEKWFLSVAEVQTPRSPPVHYCLREALAWGVPLDYDRPFYSRATYHHPYVIRLEPMRNTSTNGHVPGEEERPEP